MLKRKRSVKTTVKTILSDTTSPNELMMMCPTCNGTGIGQPNTGLRSVCNTCGGTSRIPSSRKRGGR